MRQALFSVAVAVVATASTVNAQPFFARGEFNGWDLSTPMTQIGPDNYQATAAGLNAGDLHQFKIADENWTVSWPGSNARVAVDAAGEINFNLMLGAFSDGWSPAQNRVGYADSGQHGWDIMGSFNGWSSAVVVLTDLGNGLYSGQTVVAAPGAYEFKFRKAGDWAITIGDDFGNSAANIGITTTGVNDTVTFELDLPNGRWRVNAVPAPGALVLLPLAGFFARRRR